MGKNSVSIKYDLGIKELEIEKLIGIIRPFADLNGEVRNEEVKVYSYIAEFKDGISIVTTINGANEKSLKNSLEFYVNNIGPPSFVYWGSNYKIAEKVLIKYGKLIKRNFSNFIFGKAVVDKKPGLFDILLEFGQ